MVLLEELKKVGGGMGLGFLVVSVNNGFPVGNVEGIVPVFEGVGDVGGGGCPPPVIVEADILQAISQ